MHVNALNYVIEMTDKAANRTMDAVEACLPIADSFNDRIHTCYAKLEET